MHLLNTSIDLAKLFWEWESFIARSRTARVPKITALFSSGERIAPAPPLDHWLVEYKNNSISK